jgi:predicted alpha/beta superfamily hydrolase
MKTIFYLIVGLFIVTACQNKVTENTAENITENTSNALVTTENGRVERIKNFPSKYVTARNVDVWLPENYNEKETYQVLYMHDGQMLFDSTNTWNHQEWGVDEAVGKLIKDGKLAKTIVVGMWNISEERHSDYFPQKPFESLDKATQKELYGLYRNEKMLLFGIPIKSDAYLKFMVEEVKPYIDSVYSTKAEMESTFIAGSSMGGLISMYAVCEYPEVFKAAACISTHWVGIFETENNPIPNAFMNYLENNLPNPKMHKLYFDYGTETLDALYEPYQLKVDKIMVSKGFDATNWITKKFEGADHSEKSWKERLPIPLEFIMN